VCRRSLGRWHGRLCDLAVGEAEAAERREGAGGGAQALEESPTWAGMCEDRRGGRRLAGA
ncbi:MAG: hypothetical protein AVDCRST_MAG77-1729, partial [uncultured Chloroflexi bacterium]